MRSKQYKRLAVTFAVEAVVYVALVFWGFPTWGIWLLLLPCIGYAIALYDAPMLAKRSAVVKMSSITVLSVLLTIAGHVVLGALFLLYCLLFKGGVPFMSGIIRGRFRFPMSPV